MRYLKAQALEELRHAVPMNLDRYREGDFADFFKEGDDVSRLLSGSFDMESLTDLKHPIPDELFDASNSSVVYEALWSLSPQQAREERIWTYLCHTTCLDYSRARWPIPEDDETASKHIRAHFFAPSLRAVERDNAVSRLWWMGMIADRAEGIDRRSALEVLMFRTDVRANLIERPTTSSSTAVFSAVLRMLRASYDGKRELYKRELNRRFMKEVNSIGGFRLLDSLSPTALDDLMQEIVRDRLKLDEI